jgi:signal transduction histidine kinase
LELKPIQIVDVIQKQVEELVPRAQQLKLSLTFTKPTMQIQSINADHERIEQVIINLVGNSLKFTPPGGVINVAIISEDKDILVKVKDNGKGMNKEDLSKLFQKFGTMGGNYLHKQEAQGTGLGLYLSKKLIEMHGGKMWAESEGEGKGSTFSFTIPLK